MPRARRHGAGTRQLRLQRLTQLDAPLLALHLAFSVPGTPNGRLSQNARSDEQATAQQNVISHGWQGRPDTAQSIVPGRFRPAHAYL
jgi:hypothetical protein